MTTTTKETPVEVLSEEVDGFVRRLHQARTAVAESDARLSEIGAARDTLAPSLFLGDEEALSTDAALAQEAQELERTREVAEGAITGFTEQLGRKKEELKEAHQHERDLKAGTLRAEVKGLQAEAEQELIEPLQAKLDEMVALGHAIDGVYRESGTSVITMSYVHPEERAKRWLKDQLHTWL